MKTFFAHIRNNNPDGSISALGGVTFAYQVSDDTVTYAIAKCHERDRFCKHTGRVKAGGRLNSPSYVQSFKGTKREFLDTIYGIVD